MAVMFGIFYFLMIRPQVKKQKEHQAMLAKLGKGEEVVTRGGLIGKIVSVESDEVIVLEFQDKAKARLHRSYVDAKWDGLNKKAEAAGQKPASSASGAPVVMSSSDS